MRSRLTEQAGISVRKLRIAKGWTLQQLSDSSGVPLSTLSKLELGQSSLTYDKILRICQALEIDPGLSLMQKVETRPPSTGRRSVVRSGEGDPVRLGPHQAKVAAHDLLSKSFTPMVMTLQPGQTGAQRQTLPGEVYLHILSGVVVVETDVYAPLRLTVGDAVFFDGNTEHRMYSDAEGVSCALMIVSGDEGFWRQTDKR